MRKILGIIAILMLSIAGVWAYYGNSIQTGNQINNEFNMNSMHENLEQIAQDGTYQNLLDLREELGYNVAHMVDEEEDFELWQEHYIEMKEFRENHHNFNGQEHNYRRGSSGHGFGNCMGGFN